MKTKDVFTHLLYGVVINMACLGSGSVLMG